MDNDVSQSLKKAKFIIARLEVLDANRSIAGCGHGSSSDRTRTSVVNGLRKKLSDQMNLFNEFRQKMTGGYRETIQRRYKYYTVTGENPDESVLDSLIETGQSESFLQKAIQEQERGQVMDRIVEIQERLDAVREIEKILSELHQVMDRAGLVESQGEQLDDIQIHVERASSFVTRGADQLQVARKHHKNTRKWTCFAIILLIVIVLIVILSFRPWTWNSSSGGGGTPTPPQTQTPSPPLPAT